MLIEYEKFVRDLVHPAGIALYSTLKVTNEVQSDTAAAESFAIGSIGYNLASRWVAAVIARGGTVSTPRFALISTLFENLLVNNTLYNIDDLWLMACENSIQATTSLKQLRAATPVANPSFTIDRGFQFGSTSYYNTNFIPTVHGATLNTNSTHMSVYNRYNQSYVRYGYSDKGKTSKLSRKMGYLANVNDAKEILEKLYKNS